MCVTALVVPSSFHPCLQRQGPGANRTVPEGGLLRKKPRERSPRKRPRRMKTPVGRQKVGLFAQIDPRASKWLEEKARRNGLTVLRMLSKILLERMRLSGG